MKETVSWASAGLGSTESEMAPMLLSTVFPLLSGASVAMIVIVLVSPAGSSSMVQRMRRGSAIHSHVAPGPVMVPVGSGVEA